MQEEDLIKKLEKTKSPQIEIPSHKKRLKIALMNWKYGKGKEAGGVFLVFKKALIPLGTAAAILLIVLIINNLITPQYTLAEVREIAMQDPQIKELVEEGAEIKDIEIIKNKAYVLISPKEIPEKEVSVEKIEAEEKKFKGALVEIELKKKRVSELKEIAPKIIPLTQAERKRVEQLIKDSEIPVTAGEKIEIGKIESVPVPVYQMELVKKDSRVEVLPTEKEDRKAKIIYEVEGEKKEGEVNLTQERVENIRVLEAEKRETEAESWKE